MAMKAIKDTEAKVKVDIRPGPVSSAQQAAGRRFWQKLIAEVKASER